jgi:DNA excision repair protein ERCC-4
MTRIVIDTREQDPLPVRNAEVGTLYTGDYSVKGLEDHVAIERKSVSDLTGSLVNKKKNRDDDKPDEEKDNRKRFANECRRLKGLMFRRLLIVGDESEESIKSASYDLLRGMTITEYRLRHGDYRSAMNCKSLMHTLWAWEVRYDLPIVYVDTPEQGAHYVEKMLAWCCYEFKRCGKMAGKAIE